MNVERNNGSGALTLHHLVNTHRYPFLYYHEDPTKLNPFQSPTPGWLTTPKSRDVVLERMSSLLRNREREIRSARLHHELMGFARPTKPDGTLGSPVAGPKHTDDGIMSSSLAFIVRPWGVPQIAPADRARSFMVSEKLGW